MRDVAARGETLPLESLALPAATEPNRARLARSLELLLAGGLTALVFPLAWALRAVLGLDDAEYVFGFTTFYAAFVVNDPHFSVTYLLFYDGFRRRAFGADVPRAQRLRAILAGIVVPVVLASWASAAIALRSAPSLGAMIELMFLLVGWHYAKQGFGVFTVLASRRGVTVTPTERRVVLAHAFAGWAFAWANPAVPARELEEKGVVYWGLAHPRWLELGAGAVLAVSTLALAAVMLARLRRDGRAFAWGPLALFLVTVWLWTIFSSLDPLVRYVIPALHSVQYLYFVWLLRRNQARAEEGPPAFGRPVAVRVGGLAALALALGFVFFHGAPAFLDGGLVRASRGGAVTRALGDTPYWAAIYVVVNIHHYFMDHVIWRRENAETRYLRG